jgi:hypothetical protein
MSVEKAAKFSVSAPSIGADILSRVAEACPVGTKIVTGQFFTATSDSYFDLVINLR